MIHWFLYTEVVATLVNFNLSKGRFWWHHQTERLGQAQFDFEKFPTVSPFFYYSIKWTQVSLVVKNPPGMKETRVRSLCQKDPLEKGILLLLTPVFWPGELHGLSMGLQRVGHDSMTFTHFTNWTHLIESNRSMLKPMSYFLKHLFILFFFI